MGCGSVRRCSVVRAHGSPRSTAQLSLPLDREAFFASVPIGRVFSTLRAAGYRREVAHRITGFMTNTVPAVELSAAPAPVVHRVGRLLRHVHLPQGAPTSPAAANLAAYGLDRRLTALAQSFDATDSRYADDLTLSGGQELRRGLGRCLEVTRSVVADEGFRVNHRKTRVMTRSQAQQVLGVVVNERTNASRRDVDRLRAELHEARTKGPAVANRRGVVDYRSHLRGRIEWVGQLNSDRADKLRRSFDSIDWTSSDEE